MKFLNWMQSKLKGGQGEKRPNAVRVTNHTNEEPPKEEFRDWPNGLLAIGTFGNTDLSDKREIVQVDQNETPQGDECSSPDLSEFTSEELEKLQKELTKLLSRKPTSKLVEEVPIADLPLDRFLNCPSSLEVDRTSSNRFSTYSDDKDEEEIDRTIRIILGRCKDVCEKKKKTTIGKKSLAFLVKKMFVCRSGFSPSPSLRDTFQESRMEKLLRTMLSKTIYPHKSSRTSSTNKYIEDCRLTSKGEKEKEKESNERSSKWVKTDSEFIVLEI